MTDARLGIDGVLKEANKNLLYFLLIFIFIYFAIVLPSKYPEINVGKQQANSSISEHLSRIQIRIDALTSDLKKISRDSTKNTSVQALEKEIAALTENKIKYMLELASSPKDERISIPLISLSVNQAVILTTYPTFLLFGLCLALRYRYRLIALVPNMSSQEMGMFKYPLWAFPVPAKYAFKNLRRWFIANTLGAITHFLILFFAFDYGFSVDKSWVGMGKQNPEVVFFSLLAGAITFAFYFVTFWDLIEREWKTTPK